MGVIFHAFAYSIHTHKSAGKHTSDAVSILLPYHTLKVSALHREDQLQMKIYKL